MRLPVLISIISFVVLLIVPVHFSFAASPFTVSNPFSKSNPFKLNTTDLNISKTQTGGSVCDPSKGLCNPLKVNSISELLTTMLSFIIKIGTVVIVLMMVYTGFKFVLARGNPTEIQKARTMFMWTIIGAVVILGAQAIALGIASTVKNIVS